MAIEFDEGYPLTLRFLAVRGKYNRSVDREERAALAKQHEELVMELPDEDSREWARMSLGYCVRTKEERDAIGD